MHRPFRCARGMLVVAFAVAVAVGCGDEHQPVVPLTGTLAIDATPDDLAAPWQVTGPDGYAQSGSGDATFADLAPGDYTLAWGDVAGWSAPEPATATQALAAGEEVEFAGTYVDRFPFPDTPQQLMTNFRNAYDEMDLGEYGAALHPDFRFVFAEGSSAAPPSGVYTRAEDLQSTANMFAGEPGHGPGGEPMVGVRDVEFERLVRFSDWDVAPGNDPYFPYATQAFFEVRVVFDLDTEDPSTITVFSLQRFYVKAMAEAQPGGGTRCHFYLIGHQELVVGLSAARSSAPMDESIDWGAIKALYLSTTPGI
ncbi:MAG: hypothetical protein IPM94_11310 [bacterium]|nr:hypothetical protein [bacterium]